MRTISRAALCAVALGAAAPAYAADLVIWWAKGISEVEDQQLRDAIATWEAETGKSVEISFLGTDDVSKKTVAAVEAGQPPDLAFAFNFDLSNSPTWAYDGRLADVSDVLEPIADRFQPSALESVRMLNGETGETGYYAVPWSQMTPMIHYWSDLLGEAGHTAEDIPKSWNAFFDFWCDDVQPALRAKGTRTRGLGQSASTSLNDSFFLIHMWLDAYGVNVLDEGGNLTLTDPATRERAIEAIAAYVEPITSGCAPPDNTTWKGADDNTAFLNKQFVVHMNPTLSSPLSQLESNPEAYNETIRTIPWPDRVDGTPANALVSVKQVVTFADSPHPENAKDFLRHLLAEGTMGAILKGGGGRFTPVMPALLADPFYSDPADPHRSAMYTTFTEGQTKPYPHAYNWRYGRVMSEGVWQRALGRVIADGDTPAEAVDQAIAEIEAILADDR